MDVGLGLVLREGLGLGLYSSGIRRIATALQSKVYQNTLRKLDANGTHIRQYQLFL